MFPPDPERRLRALSPARWEALKLLALAGVVFLTARLCIALPHGAQRIAPIWIPNAIGLAALLRSDVRRWPRLVAVCAAGHASASLSSGFPPASAAVFVVSGALEYLAAALIFRKVVGVEPDMAKPRHLIVLCAAGAGCALATGVVEGFGLHLSVNADPLASFRAWALCQPLSVMLVTPCLLVLSRPGLHLAERRLTARAWWALAALCGVMLLVFGQTRFPILFLGPPALVAVSLEAGLFGGALAVLITAAIALPATILGFGPVALSHGDLCEKAAVLQLFLTVSLFTSLPVAGLQARWRKAQAVAEEEARRARRAEALAVDGEARHRILTDKAPDAIGAMDMSGVLTFVSPAVEDITGYTPDELIGQDISRNVAADDLPRLKDNFRRLLAAGDGTGEPIEYRLRRKDGDWVWLQANPRIVRDAAGEPVGTVDVVRDISVRKAMEQRLEAALEQAQAGAQAKSEFLANMSHELRTPLTGVLGYADVLRSDPDVPPASRRHAERILAAGSMLLTLVNDVLDLSRAEAGGLTLRPRTTDLAEVLHTSLDMVRPQAQERGLTLCVEHDGCELPVTADADRLQQVLVNLLGNAVKFTPSGTVTASLRCRRGDDEVDVRLSVTDTGIGIPADRLLRIFDRFEQADGSIYRAFGGAGLGLAISRTLIRAMGGELTVESTLGVGSVFTARLRLPFASAELAAPTAAAAPVPATDASAGEFDGLHVLLADDIPVNRDLIGLMLAPLRVHLHAVADGAAAVEAAAAHPFDVVLMDMQMPVMDGLEATRRIRATHGPSAGARIVALTAGVSAEDVERCRLAGMDDHLGKPLTAADLATQLRAALPAQAGRPARAA